MKTKYLSNESGWSLLEVLIGMIVLAVGLLGLAPMLTMSIEGNMMSRDNTVAASLAKEQVELYEGMSALPATPFTQTETGLEGGKYNRLTFLRGHATDTLIPTGVFQIDVQVSWTDGSNVPRTTRYSTFILEP